MSVRTFLTDYWIYIAALGAVIWNIYLHIKANKTKRKDIQQKAYIELSSIINDFQVDCLKLVQIDAEAMAFRLKVTEDLNKGEQILENVREAIETTLSKKHTFDEYLETLPDDCEELGEKSLIHLTKELELKELKLKELELKLAEVELFQKDYEEQFSKNIKLLDSARDIQQLAVKEISSFNESLRQRIILLSRVVIKLTNGLTSSSGWQLSASKSMVKVIASLESSASELRLKILELMDTESEKINIALILKSEEFKNTWKWAANAIQTMREELL